MTWIQHHANSERLSADAEAAKHRGDRSLALQLYEQAAKAEEKAIADLGPSKARTLGISVVSAVALYYKAGAFEAAERLAHTWLALEKMPAFAADQLRGLLQSVWSEQVRRRASVNFAPGQVLVSIRGGETVEGGAPLDLIVEKVQTVQAMFYRTAEFLRGLPHRKRGGPTKDIQDICRPWLFQAAPGSYQFAVAVQEQRQRTLFKDGELEPKEVADHFLRIVRASAESPEAELPDLVPDQAYRSTFLKLARNLTPTGKRFAQLELRSASQDSGLVLSQGSRAIVAKAIQAARPAVTSEAYTDEEVKGILRAAHLDHDSIEVTVDGEHIRIDQAGDVIDDVIGPLMNRPVLVKVARDAFGKRHYRDIEADD